MSEWAQARQISPEHVGAVPITNSIDAVVGTTATLLTRPSGRKVLILAVQAGEFHVKPGDYVQRTFADSDINTTTDRITITGHGFATGDGPYKMTTDDTLPEPFASAPNQLAWVRVIDDDTIELYDSFDEALDILSTTGQVDFADDGTGNHFLPEEVPSASATSTDGYSSVRLERGTADPQGLQSGSVSRVSAPAEITVQGQGPGDRLEYWWA